MNTIKYSREDPRITWRLLVAPCIGINLGTFLGFMSIFSSDQFISIWVGGASGLFIGFIVGVCWQFVNPFRREKIPYFTFSFIGLIVGIFLINAFSLLHHNLNQMKLIQELGSLDAGTLNELIVMEKYGTKIIARVDDNEALIDFTEACRDVQKYQPIPNSNPKIIFSCYVKMSNDFPCGLTIQYYEGQDQQIVGSFARREGSTTHFYGTFTSSKLREWFDNYVM